MTTLQFANNAASTLAGGISNSATTLQLAAGTGTIFPALSAGQAFFMTLTDAETQEVREIVEVTARSGDVCTVVRGAQGTTALAWNAGDIAAQLNTAGDMQGMVQPDTLQSNFYGNATDVGGTVNSITATLPSGLTALVDGMQFIVFAAGANTGAVTLTLTLGSTVLGSHPVHKYGSSGLNAGDIPVAGFPLALVWSATLGAYELLNPGTGVAGSIAGGAANEVLVQTGAGTTGFVAAPTIAGSVLAWSGTILAWVAAAVTSFNGRGGAVTPQAGDYNAAMVGAVAEAAFDSPNSFFGNPMFIVLPPDGSGRSFIIQAGSQAITPNTRLPISFPKIFPNACVAVTLGPNNNAAQVISQNTAGFVYLDNGTFLNWIAIGY
jgi:hypothetical protein